MDILYKKKYLKYKKKYLNLKLLYNINDLKGGSLIGIASGIASMMRRIRSSFNNEVQVAPDIINNGQAESKSFSSINNPLYKEPKALLKQESRKPYSKPPKPNSKPSISLQYSKIIVDQQSKAYTDILLKSSYYDNLKKIFKPSDDVAESMQQTSKDFNVNAHTHYAPFIKINEDLNNGIDAIINNSLDTYTITINDTIKNAHDIYKRNLHFMSKNKILAFLKNLLTAVNDSIKSIQNDKEQNITTYYIAHITNFNRIVYIYNQRLEYNNILYKNKLQSLYSESVRMNVLIQSLVKKFGNTTILKENNDVNTLCQMLIGQLHILQNTYLQKYDIHQFNTDVIHFISYINDTVENTKDILYKVEDSDTTQVMLIFISNLQNILVNSLKQIRRYYDEYDKIPSNEDENDGYLPYYLPYHRYELLNNLNTIYLILHDHFGIKLDNIALPKLDEDHPSSTSTTNERHKKLNSVSLDSAVPLDSAISVKHKGSGDFLI